jgi:hypothetical protein
MAPDMLGAAPRCEAADDRQITKFGSSCSLAQNVPATQEPSALSPDRRTSLTGLSVAIRDVQIRLAREDIYSALCPVSHDSEAALLCIENDDDEGLEHDLRRAVDGVRRAGQKHKELRGLLSDSGRVVVS